MNIKNCRICGRIYNYVAGPNICPGCKDSLEAKFQEVKEYIREHKGCTINQVADACDVEASQVREWLRDERLEVTEDSALFLTCDSCGAPIRSGRFCDSCRNQVTNGLNQIVNANRPVVEKPKPKEKENPKMRFLG